MWQHCFGTVINELVDNELLDELSGSKNIIRSINQSLIGFGLPKFDDVYDLTIYMFVMLIVMVLATFTNSMMPRPQQSLKLQLIIPKIVKDY